MMLIKSLFTKLLLIQAFIFTTSSAFATGGAITFTLTSTQSPTAVPTLSGMMLILLSLLLVLVAFKVGKQKGSNAGKFFITILGVTALVSGGSGIKLVGDANAAVSAPPVITEKFLSIDDFDVDGITGYKLVAEELHHFKNTIVPAQTIRIDVTPGDTSVCKGFAEDGDTTISCVDNSNLEPNQVCSIVCGPKLVPLPA